MNWSCPFWLDWFHGGLQFQIEHHLFPGLPRHNLRKASLLVHPLCRDLELHYHSPSFFGVSSSSSLLSCRVMPHFSLMLTMARVPDVLVRNSSTSK